MPRRVLARSAARVARYAVAVAVLMELACTRGGRPLGSGPSPNADARVVRVSLGTVPTAVLSATDAWRLLDREAQVVARGGSGQRMSVSSMGGVIRLVDAGGSSRELASPLSLVAASPGATISVNQRRYRGEISVVGSDSGVQVINRLSLEAYLRGVVPRELGVRGPSDRAALEAQAVAARSYALARLGNAARAFDLTATPSDQVYGGVDAENSLADSAVAATAGLVVMYGGRVVSAPYHSTCGGSTAEPQEVWRERSEPFLQRVSDQIPGSDRYYCDIAPRFRWERSWRGDTLTAVIERYLRTYTTVPAGPVGTVRDVSIDSRTPSGRVAAIWIETDRRRYRIQGNDIRYVLRSPGGELLNSTYFSAEVVTAPNGRLARLTTRGVGYGHGVGLCQWGAIGRARAGQDFRTILRTYFPGTSVARAY